jgi:CYTH domain-containing protein
VDEFHGDNEGLVVAEIELESKDEEFELPDFVGDEVTGDAKYYNACLFKKPYKAW